MPHPHDVMTPTELARVVTEVESQLVPMRDPRGRRVMVIREWVDARRGAGYEIVEES